MKKRLLIIAVAVLAAALILYFAYGRSGNELSMVRSSGIVEGTEVNLSAKVPGRVLEICCKEGDAVKEGQVIVRLESDDIRASVAQARAGVEQARADSASAGSAVEHAKAALQSAEADIQVAEADIENAKVRMDEQKLERDRSRELYQKEYISKSSLDQVVAAYDASVATFRSSQARLAASRAKKEAAAAQVRAAVNQLASSGARMKETEANLAFHESKLQDMVIASPIAGTVVFKAIEEGEQASVGATILTIVDTANLYVRTDLEETAVTAITLNAEARVTAEGLRGKEFRGKVTEIGRYAEFATQRDVTRGRQDIKTFRVKVRAEDPEGLLKPGMTVFVEIGRKS